jgi:uncharacterized LabA/DUF88 family protein
VWRQIRLDKDDPVEIVRLRWIGPGRRAPPPGARENVYVRARQSFDRRLQKVANRGERSGQIGAQTNHYRLIPIGIVKAARFIDPVHGSVPMAFYPTDRLALFIDGTNLYAASKALGFDIDYKKLLEEFRKRGVMMRAYYYTALAEDQDYSPLRPLVDWLDYNGFTMMTKPAREFTDREGRKRWRGDMDMEIAVDMLELAPSLDHMVLFSGDGDFRCLVEAVQRKGVRVTVVSTVKSQPPMASDDLRRQADSFVDLADLEDLIGRPARLPRFIQEPTSG